MLQEMRVSNISKTISTLAQLPCLLLIGAALGGSAWGQSPWESFCDHLNRAVVQSFNPSKVDRNEVYSDECVFEFTIDSENDVTLRVEIFKTRKETSSGFTMSREVFCFEAPGSSNIPCKTKKVSWWDSVLVSSSKTNNLALLRKDRFLVTMLSANQKTLDEMERLLRRSNFNSWSKRK